MSGSSCSVGGRAGDGTADWYRDRSLGTALAAVDTTGRFPGRRRSRLPRGIRRPGGSERDRDTHRGTSGPGRGAAASRQLRMFLCGRCAGHSSTRAAIRALCPCLAGPLACAGHPWRKAASGCGSGRGGTWAKGFITAAWLWAWTVMAGGRNAGTRPGGRRSGGSWPRRWPAAGSGDASLGRTARARSATVPAGCRWLFGA